MDRPVFEHADGSPDGSQVAEPIVDDVSGPPHQARQYVATLGEVMEAGIHQRPMLAVAAAAVLGYMVGRLLYRRELT